MHHIDLQIQLYRYLDTVACKLAIGINSIFDIILIELNKIQRPGSPTSLTFEASSNIKIRGDPQAKTKRRTISEFLCKPVPCEYSFSVYPPQSGYNCLCQPN